MTTLEHLHRERERHGLLSRKRLPHIFLVRQELLACHESTLPPGLFFSLRRTGRDRIYSASKRMNVRVPILRVFANGVPVELAQWGEEGRDVKFQRPSFHQPAYLLTTSKVTPCFGILEVNTPDRRPKSFCFQTSRTLPPLLNPISLRSTDTSRVLQLRLKSPTATRPPLSGLVQTSRSPLSYKRSPCFPSAS